MRISKAADKCLLTSYANILPLFSFILWNTKSALYLCRHFYKLVRVLGFLQQFMLQNCL